MAFDPSAGMDVHARLNRGFAAPLHREAVFNCGQDFSVGEAESLDIKAVEEIEIDGGCVFWSHDKLVAGKFGGGKCPFEKVWHFDWNCL